MTGQSSIGRLKTQVRRVVPNDARLRLRAAVYRRPALAKVWFKLDPELGVAAITPDTVLVMDGFQRSGNTYARSAFIHANGEDVPISTHMHSPLSVRLAAERGLPMILLIRNPKDSVASYLQFLPESDAATAIREYRHYYEQALPYLDHPLVVQFERITKDFGGVVAECNAKFGTSFRGYEATAEAEAEVRTYIEDAYAGTKNFEGMVPRPSATRRRSDDMLAGFSDTDREALARAEELYESIIERWVH